MEDQLVQLILIMFRYPDLTLKFDTQELVTALGEVSGGDMWMLHLSGALQDGTGIEGTDCIEIIKKGKKE